MKIQSPTRSRKYRDSRNSVPVGENSSGSSVACSGSSGVLTTISVE
jgi:hypothetical protein